MSADEPTGLMREILNDMNTVPPPSLMGEIAIHEMCERAAATPPGKFLELGVYKGGSAYWLYEVAKRQGRELHLFDSFAGMPEGAEPWEKHQVGKFTDTNVDEVRKHVPSAIYHVGRFPETLPEGLRDIAFVHVDTDTKRSYLDAIKYLYPRLVPGGVMAFDDIELLGARLALHESGLLFKFDAAGKPYTVKE